MDAIRQHFTHRLYKELIPLCCNGNVDAAEYLKRLFFIVRAIDDVWDGDRNTMKEDIVDAFFLFMADIACNLFYKQHQEKLTALNIVAFNAWQDANEWEKDSDSLKQLYAHVLRDYICDVLIYTAYLTGGRRHMRSISLQVRGAFVKELGE